MGMFGLIIASIVNIFLASSMVAWIISIVAVLVFTAMTAYDTQNLKEEYLSNGEVYGLDSKEKSSIFGALTLYLNFVILFEHLLALLGQKNE
jgi:FtsH-binding integral membrane protein